VHPVCFHIGSRPIYWYGVLMAAAFLTGIAHWRRLGRRQGRDSAFVTDLAFWIMIGGILGARAVYVLENLGEYLKEPLTILRVDQGGLTYYGGFLGSGLAIALFARRHHEPLDALLDFVITAVPLGHALGRVGCFLNGCCFGRPSDLPWAVAMEGARRHPVQLYEAAVNLLLYGVLTAFALRRPPPGRVLALYLLTYGPARFVLERFRGDEQLMTLGLSSAQWVSLVLAAVGLALWHRAPGERRAPADRRSA
jgi:phosphatidylglycerol---prolipoprotein diacylglyceryl transferase